MATTNVDTTVVFPGGTSGYKPYTFAQIMAIIRYNIGQVREETGKGVPDDLAYAIAWVESGFNTNAAGDWIDNNTGETVAAYTANSHPRSIGLFQLNEAGLGHGLNYADRVDPYTNTYTGIRNLAATYDPDNLAVWAYNSQNPADRSKYITLINRALVDKPWLQQNRDAVANPYDPEHETGPGGVSGGGGSGGHSGTTDPGETGSGLPNIVEVDPIVLGSIPLLGDVTLNMTPIVNWGIRIGVSVIGIGLMVYGVILLTQPNDDTKKAATEVLSKVAVAG